MKSEPLTETGAELNQALRSYARSIGLQLHFSETETAGTALYPVTHHKRWFWMEKGQGISPILAGYHDPRDVTDNGLFFGAFIQVNFPLVYQVKFRKRTFLDRFLPSPGRVKTGSSSFDSAVLMKTDQIRARELLFMPGLQKAIVMGMDVYPSMEAGINCLSLSFIPTFEDQSWFGLFTRQHWLSEPFLIGECLRITHLAAIHFPNRS